MTAAALHVHRHPRPTAHPTHIHGLTSRTAPPTAIHRRALPHTALSRHGVDVSETALAGNVHHTGRAGNRHGHRDRAVVAAPPRPTHALVSAPITSRGVTALVGMSAVGVTDAGAGHLCGARLTVHRHRCPRCTRCVRHQGVVRTTACHIATVGHWAWGTGAGAGVGGCAWCTRDHRGAGTPGPNTPGHHRSRAGTTVTGTDGCGPHLPGTGESRQGPGARGQGDPRSNAQ